MGIIRTFLGPKSKYDKSLPYTYEARIDMLSGQGDEPLYNHYIADTVCGLIEYLDNENILPDAVQLYGIYLGKEIPLEIPEDLVRALEEELEKLQMQIPREFYEKLYNIDIEK